MDNKIMGSLVLAAVAIIIGTAIFTGSVAPSIGTMTQSQTATNVSYTAGAVNTSIDLTGQELLSTPIVLNGTNTVIASGNYTLTEGVSPRSGVKRILLTFNDAGSAYASKTVKVSYTYGPEGYVEDAGARGVANLIPIAVALALMGAAFVAIKWDDWF